MTKRDTYILAIDQGTSSTRALVLDRHGAVIGTSQESFTIPAIHAAPGWVEREPRHLWQSVCSAVRSAVHAAGIGFEHIAGIGLANQGETVIAFDALTGEPYGNAISWQDRRTEAMVQGWRAEGLEADVARISGLHLDPYFSASKLKWLLDFDANAREAYGRGRLHLGTSDAWLLWQLTGGRSFITDAATASRTMLLSLEDIQFSRTLLDIFGIPRETLPALVDNILDSASAPRTNKEVFGREIPITGLCVDQHAALFGHGCLARNQIKITYGTGCFMLANAGSDPHVRAQGLLTALGWRMDNKATYIIEGGVYSAGSLIDWLVSLGLIGSASELDIVASSITNPGDVMMIPALGGLAAPYWNGKARAAWLGMDASTSKAHMVYAAMEAIAFRIRDICDSMQQAGVEPSELCVDGGLTRSRALMQLQADVVGCPVGISDNPEVTALGVGLMAGIGAGIWDDLASLPRVAAAGARMMPRDAVVTSLRRRYRRWRNACEAVARLPPGSDEEHNV